MRYVTFTLIYFLGLKYMELPFESKFYFPAIIIGSFIDFTIFVIRRNLEDK